MLAANANVVEGNIIGLKTRGNGQARQNGTHGGGYDQSGILVEDSTAGLVMGGTDRRTRNIISGNVGNGITWMACPRGR